MRNLLFVINLFLLISCGNSSALKVEFIRQRILDYKANSDTLTISDELLKWDTTDLIVKYLDKTIDTTTQALELINASPTNRNKIIFLINNLIKMDIDSFKEQIKHQSTNPPIKNESKIRGDSMMPDRTIKFSQPLVSSDNNTIIIKEWDSGNDCWGTRITVFQMVNNKWRRDYDLYQHRICI
jgi:hypothetical protein